MSIVSSFIGGGVVGSVLGSFVTHLFARHRRNQDWARSAEQARRARKYEFLMFLGDWKAAVKTTHPMNYISLRDERVEPFKVEAERLRNDIPENLRGEFDRLVSAISNLTNEAIVEGDERHGPRDLYLHPIDRLIDFTREN